MASNLSLPGNMQLESRPVAFLSLNRVPLCIGLYRAVSWACPVLLHTILLVHELTACSQWRCPGAVRICHDRVVS